MKSLVRWNREVSLHLHSFAVAVLLIMVAFYAIVAFRVQRVLDWLCWRVVYHEIFVYYVAIWSGVFLLGITTKAGALWLLGPKPTRWRVLRKAFMAVSLYLVLIGSSVSACLLLTRRLLTLLGSRYWAESQWFWLGVLLFLVFGFLSLVLREYGLYSSSVLRELRALPIVSPLFCFAGPKFFLDNAQKFGVSANDLRAHAIWALHLLSR